jgi:undecaprenyl pyrophosphate phosphatase UppP
MYEKLWLLAAVVAIIVMIVNIFIYKKFDYHVYFPIFVCMATIAMYFTKRNHRRFMEKMEAMQERDRLEKSVDQIDQK